MAIVMKFYNTLSKTKEEFKSINPGKIGMYTCGPTVYDFIHIGNIRAYLLSDTIRRYLEYNGYEVRLIKNITDVGHLTEDDISQGDSGEDKMMKAADKEKKKPEDIAKFYEDYFRQVEKEMNILPAQYFPKATAHIPQMIKIIKGLLEKGFAYEKNGNVFFDVTKFPDYGKLSGNTLENLKVGARLEEHPDKKNPWDFALWLKAPKEHLLKWESPWGVGYPGWHIECTAMSTEYLGNTLDIHTGGEDNIFPHHEAEIAQTECYTGQKFVNYWLHLRHLMVDGQKMSKSKGNFYKLDDIKEKGFSPMDLRLLLLSAHYRSQVNFTWDVMEQSRKNLQRINDFVLNMEVVVAGNILASESFNLKSFQEKFEAAMNDDLNTPLALSVLYEMISEINKLSATNSLSSDDAKKILAFWKKINSVFGLVLSGQAEIPQEIKDLVQKREDARKGKDFKKSDDLRELIEKKGYILEDTKDGTSIKQK
ncbi:MAG TPA: cysteine--tRNA ligase [Candidatus Moranbacteria bacterium]|nr:cysteine--tRNA ligase [Candidatus Moranbacteria bacterium]